MAEYISREVIVKVIRERCSPCGEAIEAIRGVPAADVTPVVHARWEQDADGDWYCTNCDEVVAICDSGRERTYRKPYCPNCGAKMDGRDEDE